MIIFGEGNAPLVTTLEKFINSVRILVYMAHQIGDVVYVNAPYSYGVVTGILREQKATHHDGVTTEQKWWYQPGDIIVRRAESSRFRPIETHDESISSTYRLADPHFGNGIRVIDDLAGEITKLSTQLKAGTKINGDGVDLRSAVGFLDGILRERESQI